MPELASTEKRSFAETGSNALDAVAALLKERLTESSPTRLVHSEVYKKDDNTKPGASRVELQVSLKKLTDILVRAFPAYSVPDVLISLISIYLYRVSGEAIVTFGLFEQDTRKQGSDDGNASRAFVPFKILLNHADRFRDVAKKVASERGLHAINGSVPAALFEARGAGLVDAETWALPLPFAVKIIDQAEHRGSAVGEVELILDNAKGILTIGFDRKFSREIGDALVAHLASLSQSIVAKPEKPICELDLLSAEERQVIVEGWNVTATDFPYNAGLVGELEAWVQRYPEHPAVVFQGQTVTYAEFNARVNRLAAYLRKAGVRSDTFVCICLDRSIDMVIAIWAILKAGGAYVPLNVEDPPQRLAAIIRNAGARIILTEDKYVIKLPKTRTKCITLSPESEAVSKESSKNPAFDIDPSDLAYMIYTSGSTGEPKGVLIEHKAIFNRIAWMQNEYNLTPDDRVLQKTPYTFDVSVWEFLWPLTVGATLVVAEPGGHVVPSYLARLMRTESITCVHFVPSVLRLFLSCPAIEDLPLRMVFCSGEALSPDLQQRFMSCLGADLHNLYGPTEAAVDVTHWKCNSDQHRGRVPIGKPIANIKMHILDELLQPVPVGVLGELYIGGIGLARGYWNKPELTEQRFISDPFSKKPGSRLYKTGDIARYLPDGNIEYLGRNDDQVKVNGIRIELGEIESVIQAHTAVQNAAVVAKKSEFGNAQLYAYMVPKNQGKGGAALDHLRKHLERKLPPHMIPRTLTFIDRIPLTVSGKVDRKALPEPAAAV